MIQELFDRLAAGYDQDVIESDKENAFPFAGYQKTLDFIADEIAGRARLGKIRLLDLGIGTGLLETRLVPETIELTGIDLSGGMLEICRLRHPEATLHQSDFLRGIPSREEGKWDVIVSTYAMHHLSTDDLILFIDDLLGILTPFGRIYIGDILFVDAREREAVRLRNLDAWDPDEHYHAFDEILAKDGGKRAFSFLKTSFCGGVLIVEKFHELCAPECDMNLKVRR